MVWKAPPAVSQISQEAEEASSSARLASSFGRAVRRLSGRRGARGWAARWTLNQRAEVPWGIQIEEHRRAVAGGGHRQRLGQRALAGPSLGRDDCDNPHIGSILYISCAAGAMIYEHQANAVNTQTAASMVFSVFPIQPVFMSC